MIKLRIVFIVFFVGLLQSVFAYPIRPQPLRKLILESEFIIYANVFKVESIDAKDSWGKSIATLVIKENIQGDLKVDTIEVSYNSGMSCPAPANYKEGAMVLAFLVENEGIYYTQALSYGTKMLGQSAFEIYKQRILEMQMIVKIPNAKLKLKEIIAWLVRCAIFPETREEGILELSAGSEFRSKKGEDFHFSKEQIHLLKEAFFSIEDMIYSDIGLLELISKEEDPKLVEDLTCKLADTEIWFAEVLMTNLVDLTNRSDLKIILEKFKKLNFFDGDSKIQYTLVEEFLEEL